MFQATTERGEKSSFSLYLCKLKKNSLTKNKQYKVLILTFLQYKLRFKS